MGSLFRLPVACKKVFLAFCTLAAASWLAPGAHAQLANVSVSGYNSDIVANGVGPGSGSTTALVDGGVDNNKYSFIDGTYLYAATGCGTTYSTGIFPANNQIASGVASGLTYTLPSYTGNNALRIPATGNGAGSGTLTLSAPVSAAKLYLLLTCGGSAISSGLSVTVTFTDNTTQTLATDATTSDWCTANATTTYTTALSTQYYRLDASATGACGGTPALCPFLSEMTLPVTGPGIFKQIASITLTKSAGTIAVINVVAVGMQAPCTAPSNQATVLTSSGATITQVGASFTAASSAPSGYLVVRYPSGAMPTAPVDGASYTTGQALGTGTVVQLSTATSFTATGLNPATAYDFYVYSYNTGGTCGGPIFNSTAPLTATFSSVSCSGLSGTYSVGPSAGAAYSSLTAALNALSTTGIGGPVVFELQSTYTSTGETFPLILTSTPCFSAARTVTIRPEAAVTSGVTITSANANATIDINGGYYFRIDGRPGGTGTAQALTIQNTNTAGIAVRLINDAYRNRILYCNIQGVNTTNTGGVIQFAGTTGINGNDTNSVTYCNISGTSTSTMPATLVYSSGVASGTVAQYNNNDTVANCNLFDFYAASVSEANAFKIGSSTLGNANWALLNNSIYETTPRTATATVSMYAFNLNCPLASGYTVSGNYIGGSSAQCGGTAFTLTGSSTSVNATFQGMYVSMLVGGATSTFSNNTFANFNWTNTTSATTISSPGAWAAIRLVGGTASITNNTIGSLSGNSISLTTTANSWAYGIVGGSGSATTYPITGNTIAGITTNTASTGAVYYNFYGISVNASSSSTTYFVDNNTVGSTLANSIRAAAASTGIQSVKGIENIATTAPKAIITNNTVQNLANASAATGTTASQTVGISTLYGVDSIASNTVTALSNASAQTNVTTTASVIGISQTSTTAGASVSNNTMYNLSNTAVTAAAVTITGIYYTETTSGTNLVSGNLIYGLSVASTGTTPNILGLYIAGGNSAVQNNMIRVGIDNSGNAITAGYNIYGIYETGGTNNFYHNSLYTGGSNVVSSSNSYAFCSISTTTTARAILNNIFCNARSNASGAAVNYGIRVANTTNLRSNYNVIFAPGTGGAFGIVNATPYNVLPSWQGATAQDSFTSVTDPRFIAPTAATPNLHISASTPTPVEGFGTPVASVTTDFDGQTRSGLTPVDIGADAGNFVAGDGLPPVITYTRLVSTGNTGARVLTATITDATGVPTTGSLVPQVYYKKVSGGASSAYVSAPGTLASGTAQNGTWNFTIDPTNATIGGVALGDSVYYYVIAQDVVATPNIGSIAIGAVATNVNAVTTPPPAPFGYRIVSFLSGTVNVGAGNTYTTLTDVGGLFQQLSQNGISGDLTVQITSDLTEPGTYPLTQFAESGVGGYRVRIVPDATTERLIVNTAAGTGLRLSGVKRVTFDGRFNGSGRYLRLRSTLPAVPAFTFVNDAQQDSLAYCVVEGNNTSTGNILFGASAGGSGNDLNVVTGNLIRDLTANPYATLVTTTNTGVSCANGTDNSDNILSNNEFLNCIYNGVNLNSGMTTGNNWTITGNSFYYSATLANSGMAIIYVQAGTGHTISNNSIGGSASDRSGTAATNSNSGAVYAMQLAVGTGTPTVVSNNTVSNFAASGSAQITGIYATSGTVTIQNNTIGGGAQPYDTIRTGGANGLITIAGATATVSNNTLKNCASYNATAIRVAGIYVSSGTATITNNIIDNIRSYGAGTSATTAPVGILLASGGHTVTGNTVSNIYNTQNTLSDATAYVAAGIASSSGGSTYSRNRIYNIYGMVLSPALYGLFISSTGTETAFNNQISLGGNTIGQPVMYGIYDASTGAHNYFNNSVYLNGAATSGTNSTYAFYRASTSTVLLRNNILYNGHTTAGTGYNYALGFSTVLSNPASSNYNLLVTPDASALVQQSGNLSASGYNALFTTSYNSNWMADAATVPASQLFINTAACDLGIVTANAESWYANGRGIALPAVATDFNGAARATTVTAGATDIGSVEFNTSAAPPSAVASAAPAAGATTTYTFGGRQIAALTWGASGTPPSSLDVKYYAGVDAPNTGSVPHFKGYYDIQATGGSGYSYTISLSYDTSMLGTVTSSATARLSKYSAGTGWVTPAASSANPTTGMLSSGTSITGFSLFTGSDASQPLPIQLIDIAGVNKGGYNRIEWSTAAESVGDRFVLQRSADGSGYEDLTVVPATGRATAYAHNDAKPLAGINYYRLRLVGTTGAEAYSKAVRVLAGPEAAVVVSVYPNPAKDLLTVRTYGTPAAGGYVQLTDLTGRVLMHVPVDAPEQHIVLTHLSKGLYLVRYVSGSTVKTFQVSKTE